MGELYELVQKFDTAVAADGWYLEPIGFSLENGGAELSEWFKSIELRRYTNALVVTEIAPLVDYILSTVRLGLREYRRADLFEFIRQEMEANGGAIRITIDSGMFIARD